MNELTGCVCDEGWKGDDCSVSNDVIRCSGQGNILLLKRGVYATMDFPVMFVANQFFIPAILRV